MRHTSLMITVSSCLLATVALAAWNAPPDSTSQDSTKATPSPGVPVTDKAPPRQIDQPRRDRRPGSNRGGGPQIGTPLPAELMVHDTNGTRVSLKSITNGKPTVIVGGCLTCPKFLRTYPEIEAVARDYTPKGVQFFYLYKTLAHPENNGYIQPFTIDERRAQVAEARTALNTQVPWLTDTMENDVWAALGQRPNPHLLIGADGSVLAFAQWAQGETLRQSLAAQYGDVKPATSSRSLNLPRFNMTSTPGSGVVKRITRTDTLVPIVVRPDLSSVSETPYYTKLRAEASSALVETGSGELYLGFHLDPVHDVHWNNLVDPLQWTATTPDQVTMSPASDRGPKVAIATDIDPREFLVQVEGWSPGRSISITVNYFACSDSEGWCKPVTQTYQLVLQRDRTAGGVMGRSFRRGGGNGDRAGGRGGRPGGPDMPDNGGRNMADMMKRLDLNGDGQLSKDELPERMQKRFDRMDTNSDGVVDQTEMESIQKRMKQRGRPGGV